jgi:hypothetical protein
VCDIQRDGCDVVVELFCKAVRQPREPTLAHAQRKVLPLNVAGRNVLVGIARYYFLA